MTDRSVEHSYHADHFPYFERPQTPNRIYDLMYAVSCDTRVTHHLISIAREEFLSLWLSNEDMLPYLEGWSTSVSLQEITDDIADFLDHVAQHLDLSRRADLARTLSALPDRQTLVEGFLPEWYRLQDCLYAAYRRGNEMFDAVEEYVRYELQQPWPWLVGRLTDHIFQQAWEWAMGITLVHERTPPLSNLWDPRVQPFRSVFETRPGETVAEAKQRRMAEALEDCKNFHAIEQPAAWLNLPKGSLRKDQEPNTLRNTRWLYQVLMAKVHGPEISQYDLARAYHDTGRTHRGKRKEWSSCSCQKDVSDGIKSAQRLLDATPYIFC
jgi:hypothetical protein